MVIGICGFARSGKSTIADYLVKEHGFKKVGFKDALVADMKEKFPDLLQLLANMECMMRLKKKGEYTIDDLFNDKPSLMRALMQNYGTNVCRNRDPQCWVKAWNKTVRASKQNIVVDDVRFFNELSAVTEMDGILIRVKRPDIKSAGNHQSEKEQTLFIEDFLIEAWAGHTDDLYEQVEEVIKVIKNNND